jgi:hypothetical protein
MSLQADYASDVATALVQTPADATVTDDDLAGLPLPVQRYLRAAGVVGQPRVANFRVRMHGRIRRDARSKWLPLRAEQYNVVENRQRFFYLTSSLFGVPVRGYHRYCDAAACMDVRAAGVIPIVRTSGPEMFQSETVTMLNDMCLFAPATLIDPALVWEEADRHSVRVSFTNRGVTVRAELTFNHGGELIDFASDDRYQASADGRQQRRRRWSTPVIAYRTFGPMRLIASGEGRWHAAEGSFVYLEVEIDDIVYNLRTL